MYASNTTHQDIKVIILDIYHTCKKRKVVCKNRNLFPITFPHHFNSLEVAPDCGLVIRIHTRKNVICVQPRGGHEFLCRGGHACGGLALQRLGFQGLHNIPEYLVSS